MINNAIMFWKFGSPSAQHNSLEFQVEMIIQKVKWLGSSVYSKKQMSNMSMVVCTFYLWKLQKHFQNLLEDNSILKSKSCPGDSKSDNTHDSIKLVKFHHQKH